MALMDKLKKGLDVAAKNAKTAGNVAVLKTDLESNKSKRGKRAKELGELVYKLKEKFEDVEELEALLIEIEALDNTIEVLKEKMTEETENFGG